MHAKLIKVEVAYATPEKQLIVEVEVPEGCTLLQAALQSGIDKEFPGLDIQQSAMGLFGRKVAKVNEEILREGDRVEIYRPLLIDPKQARLNRAAKNKKE
ncbi:MAG: RnfH family protein [Reinekea sp.]|jgi:putative ubiquitin-RnfH superfamily antitoxin RatB of RatAB toxin-antitoxin module|nr:RnfH family protein [Reinekea sp.]MDX1473618.1 RnfH family protein [Reinekea sp.]